MTQTLFDLFWSFSKQALDAVLSLDIPFWPQLPRLSYYEDMYVQASEHFPGIILDLDILSMDTHLNGEIFASYAGSINRFLDRGGVLVWGIVPTNVEPFEKESMDSLQTLLEDVWAVLNKKGIDTDYILSRSLISPATGGIRTVKKP
jgi:hypothetical protein